MTSPFPMLPNTERGNSFLDAGSAARTFVEGLTAQRQRMAQIAMQQALANANIDRLGAAADADRNQGTLYAAQAEDLAYAPSEEEWTTFTQSRPEFAGVPPQLRRQAIDSWSRGAGQPDRYTFIPTIDPENPTAPPRFVPGNLRSGVIGDPTDRGPIPRAGTTSTTTTGGFLDNKLHLGAANALSALNNLRNLELNPATRGSNRISWGAAAAEGAEEVAGMSGVMRGLRNWLMPANNQQYRNAINQIVHNIVGLLPGSRQSIVLFMSLQDALRAEPNEAPESIAYKTQLMFELIPRLEAIYNGQRVPLHDVLGRLPGFAGYAREFENLYDEAAQTQGAGREIYSISGTTSPGAARPQAQPSGTTSPATTGRFSPRFLAPSTPTR